MKFGQYSIVAEPIRVPQQRLDSTSQTCTSPTASASFNPTGACAVSCRSAGARSGAAKPRLWTREELTRLGENILGLSRDYVMYRVSSACEDGAVSPPVNRYARVMRRVAKSMESRYATEFEVMFAELNMDRTTAYEMFECVVRDLFHGQTNWGRFVALFCFTGLLAVRCAVDVDMAELVPSVITWLARFVSRTLSEWICDHGGLDGFCEHFPEGYDEASVGFDLSAVLRAVAEGILFSIGLATVGLLLSWMFQQNKAGG